MNKFIENNIKSFGKLNFIKNNQKNDVLIKLSSIIKGDIKSESSIINWIEETINKKIIKFELISSIIKKGKNYYFYIGFLD